MRSDHLAARARPAVFIYSHYRIVPRDEPHVDHASTATPTGFTQTHSTPFSPARRAGLARRRCAGRPGMRSSSCRCPTAATKNGCGPTSAVFHLDHFALPRRAWPASGCVAARGAIEPTASIWPGMTSRSTAGRQPASSIRHWAARASSLAASTGCWPSMATCCAPISARRSINPASDKFAALHAACWSGGTVLYVPRGVVDRPARCTSCRAVAGGVDFGHDAGHSGRRGRGHAAGRNGQRRPAAAGLALRRDRTVRRSAARGCAT